MTETATPSATDIFDQMLATPTEDPFAGTTPTESVTFTDQIATPTAADQEVVSYLRKLDKEMKEGQFGQVDLQDFTDFNNIGKVVEEGSYTFTIESQHLKQATSIIHEISGAGTGKGDASVRVTIFSDRLKLAAANTAAFAEIIIRTKEPTTNLAPGQTIAFIFEKKKLVELTRSFRGDALITFNYLADRATLQIQSESTELNLTTWEEALFPNYHNNLSTPKFLGDLDPGALQDALRFLMIYVTKDDLQQNLSLIDFHQAIPALSEFGGHNQPTGRGVTGSANAIGVYDCQKLPRTPFRIRYNAINLVVKILGRLHPDKTQIFKSGNFILLRDQNLYFGIEASDFTFPPVEKILASVADSHILIPRDDLDRALFRLRVVNPDATALVHFSIEGAGNKTRLTLEAKDTAGKVSHDSLMVSRRSNPGHDPDALRDVDFSVNLATLRATIAYTKTPAIKLEFVGLALRVIEADANVQAISTLTVLSEEAVAKQRAIQANKSKKGSPKEKEKESVPEVELEDAAE